MAALASRMARELRALQAAPPAGVSCWPVDDSVRRLRAKVLGPEGTPYEGGWFELDVAMPERCARARAAGPHARARCCPPLRRRQLSRSVSRAQLASRASPRAGTRSSRPACSS